MKYILTLLLAVGVFVVGAQDLGSYELRKLENLNSNVDEFAPVPYQNGLIFTSNRSKGKLVACYDKTGGRYNDIFVATSTQPEDMKNATRLLGESNAKYHDGVVAFSPDGNTMYFSRNDTEKEGMTCPVVQKIYQATKTESGWGSILPLPFNGDDFNTMHPTLSADGNTMYFASNRPGSAGGNDIYKVMRVDGKWGEPMNLGANINTSGNEVFPYISDTGMLYFSSSDHGSVGGLDIFTTSPDGTDWTAPKAMMSPINSAADDLTFIIATPGEKGYFASAREGGQGNDDIYEWKYIPPDLIDLDMMIVDVRNERPLADANITVTPVYCDIPVMNDEQTGTSDTNGKFRYQIYDACTYMITVEREGYAPYQMEVTGLELKEAGTYQVPLTPLTSQLAGNVFNTKNQAAVPGATVVLVNLTTGEEQTLTADANGQFAATLICTDDYEIRATANQFKDNSVQLSAAAINCNGQTAQRIGLEPNPPVIVVLENIYYDYNKDNIRTDAATRLDKLVDVMNRYPSLEVEFRAHTDARGSNRYNQDLADRRAKRALEYVVSKGISPARVGISGYGETELTNDCTNGKRCSEEEHQRNRRTTISIRRFDAENTRIQIIDNPTFPVGAGKKVYRETKI